MSEQKMREALEKSAQGWANVIELGLLPPQHVDAATVLRDIAREALAEQPAQGDLAAQLAIARDTIDRLRSEPFLAAQPAQGEPVGEMVFDPDDGDCVSWFVDSLKPGTKLYTAPPAPNVPALTLVGFSDLFAEQFEALAGSVTSDLVKDAARLAAAHAFKIATATTPPVPGVPANCRQRLMKEGKPYPRSSCNACGVSSPKWRECDAMLAAAPGVNRG